MSIADRVDVLEKTVEELKATVDALAKNSQSVASNLQMMMQRLMSTEQAATAMGKTMAALSEELVDNEVINQDSVMDRVRKFEDDDQRNQVKSYIDSGTIASAEEITEDSLIVAELIVVDTETGKSQLVSEYSFLSINSPNFSPEFQKELIGKKVGHTFEGNSAGNKKELIKVKEIYSVVENKVPGDTPEAPEDKKENTGQGEPAQASEGTEVKESKE